MNTETPVKQNIKFRAYTNPRAFQLIREAATSRFAAKALPKQIGEVSIRVPEIEVKFIRNGIQVSSTWMQGENLNYSLYKPEQREAALSMGLVTLQAFMSAQFQGCPFWFWNYIYHPIRRLKTYFLEYSGSSLLTTEERKHFFSMIRHQPLQGNWIVHGNLHSGNIIADYRNKSLAIVDLEMLHIGNPVVDHAMIWLSYALASLSLAKQFWSLLTDTLQFTSKKNYMEWFCSEVALETYLMIHKAKAAQNIALEEKSKAILKTLLESKDMYGLLGF